MQPTPQTGGRLGTPVRQCSVPPCVRCDCGRCNTRVRSRSTGNEDPNYRELFVLKTPSALILNNFCHSSENSALRQQLSALNRSAKRPWFPKTRSVLIPEHFFPATFRGISVGWNPRSQQRPAVVNGIACVIRDNHLRAQRQHEPRRRRRLAAAGIGETVPCMPKDGPTPIVTAHHLLLIADVFKDAFALNLNAELRSLVRGESASSPASLTKSGAAACGPAFYRRP